MKKEKYFMLGIKDYEPNPYKKRMETKRKLITSLIALPIIFLIEILVISTNIQEDPIIVACIFVFFGAIPFMIGALPTMHFSYKISITITIIIFIWVMVMLLMFWDQAPAPGVYYVTDNEILSCIGKGVIKTLISGSMITLLGHAIKKTFINTKD
jgi:hypothetical protein